MKPDPQLFQRLLAESAENEWLEFKKNWFDPGAIGRYASALANSARIVGKAEGYLVWGVDDDRHVVGTTLDVRNQAVQKEPFHFWLKKRLDPQDHSVQFYEGELQGKRMLAMITEAADRVPVRFDGAAYIRVGSATPPLHEYPDFEERLLAALTATNYEEQPAREYVTVDEVGELLDVPRAVALLQQPPATSLLAQVRQLERFDLVSEGADGTWSISNLGAILFALELQEFGREYERKAPRVVVYGGDNRLRTLSERVGKRGYAAGFEGLTALLDRHLPRNEVMKGVLRTDQPVYPMIALREAAANMLVHQDLSIRGAGPIVEIFDDRIEFSNPGRPLIDVDRLIDEPPRSRNESLARLMRQIGYCEERGSGIDKIIAFAEVAQLPPPHFSVKEHGFVATMYAPRSFVDMTGEERLRAVYQHAGLMWVSGGKTATNGSLRKRFGLDQKRTAGISRLLADAVERGLIKPAQPGNQSRAQAAYVPYWA